MLFLLILQLLFILEYQRPERLSHVRQRELHPAFRGSRESPLPEKQTKKSKKAKNASPDSSPQRLHQIPKIAAKKVLIKFAEEDELAKNTVYM